MQKYKKIGVIGGGAWGSTIAIKMAVLSDVILWTFESETAENINKNRENKHFLPNVRLPNNIKASNDLSALSPCDLLFLVVPTQHIGAIVTQLKPHIKPQTPIVICSKGIEISSTRLISDILAEILPNELAVMSGPSFAAETANGLPTALTLAAQNELAQNLVENCTQPNFHLYPSDDIIGVQLGGAIKNVIAIACGIAEGAKQGKNAQAALISRGLVESTALVEKMGGNIKTLLSLAGVGDMVLTCTSLSSRNTSLGVAVGEGKSLKDILSSSDSVSEGVWTAQAIVKLATKHKIKMPICFSVNDILHKNLSVKEVVRTLLFKEIGTNNI